MKVANNSIVSVESPQWMKQPFESNRAFPRSGMCLAILMCAGNTHVHCFKTSLCIW